MKPKHSIHSNFLFDLFSTMVNARMERLGYSDEALGRWAKRALGWANGDAPPDLAAVVDQHESGRGRHGLVQDEAVQPGGLDIDDPQRRA